MAGIPTIKSVFMQGKMAEDYNVDLKRDLNDAGVEIDPEIYAVSRAGSAVA